LLAAFAAITFASPAETQPVPWWRAADVSAVRIEIKHVTAAELREVAARYERPSAPGGNRAQANRHAFSVLFTNRETGERRCEIFVSTEIKFDLATTLTHEAAHCFGFTHDTTRERR
jgi:hypothetical protein